MKHLPFVVKHQAKAIIILESKSLMSNKWKLETRLKQNLKLVQKK